MLRYYTTKYTMIMILVYLECLIPLNCVIKQAKSTKLLQVILGGEHLEESVVPCF